MAIVDTHIDIPYQLDDEMRDIGVRDETLNFDYPRAREGGLDVAFMSIYVPASYQESGGALEKGDELIDLVESVVQRHPDKFVLVTDVDAATAGLQDDRVELALGMENGAPIEDDLDNLRHFYDRGIRYITLTHSKHNQICDSSYDKEPGWNGLSEFGERVVLEMNRLGMMIDVSHVSDAAFERVLERTRAPVIASHSSCRHFTADWERNMSDEMIRKLGQNGGVIQINFGSAFLHQAAHDQSMVNWDAHEAYIEEHGLDGNDPAVEAFGKQYWEERERIYADVSDVADHIDRVVELAGVDHVGLGSDFDGVGDSLPTGLKDVSQYPNLIRELLLRGYTDEQVEKICGGNLLRVWARVEEIGREGAVGG